MNEIRISGFGGQGVIRCGYIIGKTAALFDGKHATLTQSFGPEARGSACSAQILIDSSPIRYPYVNVPDTVVAMSQEAYDKFGADITDEGALLIDEDLVKPGEATGDRRLFAIPAARIAEDLGNRIVANIVMLGFFTALTDIISVEAAREALPSSVPERFVELNAKAFEEGYQFGMGLLGKVPEGAEGKAAAKAKKPTAAKAASKKKPQARKTAAKKKPQVRKTAAKKKPQARKAAAKKKPQARKAAARKKPKARKAAARKTTKK